MHALAQTPRLTGTRDAVRAREYCRRELERLGFTVVERTFAYSQFPARFATPCAGVWSALTLVAAALLARGGAPAWSLVTAAGSLLLLVPASLWLARRGVLRFPLVRRTGVNLECTRGEAPPRVWLVAHTDTKSQLVPMLGRVMSVVLLALAWISAIVLALVELAQGTATPALVWSTVAGAGVLGAIGLAATVVGNASPGAVDDASGVAVVLAASALLPDDAPVGVLITDAEEMGLAGARAAATTLPQGTAINVDGVDDHGVLMAMYSGSRPARLLHAVSGAVAGEGQRVTERRLIPGVLVDGLALADAGWEAVTLSRGTARTLRRIHTRADALDRMSGSSIALVARILSRTVPEL